MRDCGIETNFVIYGLGMCSNFYNPCKYSNGNAICKYLILHTCTYQLWWRREGGVSFDIKFTSNRDRERKEKLMYLNPQGLTDNIVVIWSPKTPSVVKCTECFL